MKITILTIAFILSIFAFGTAAQTTPPATPKPAPSPTPEPKPEPKKDNASVDGKWSLAADAQGQTIMIAVELKQKDDTFTGTTSSDMGAGTIDGGKIVGKTFTATLHADVQGTMVDFKMEGTIDGDKMTGSFSNASFGSVPFSATKNK